VVCLNVFVFVFVFAFAFVWVREICIACGVWVQIHGMGFNIVLDEDLCGIENVCI